MAEKINGEQNTKGLVVSFGEMLIDFVPTVSGVSLAEAPGFLKAPGGAPGNVAIAVARMNGNAAFAGKLGADEFGRMLVAILKQNGVSDEGICFDEGARTALAFVTLRSDGEREFMFYRNPSADMLLRPDELNLDLIRQTLVISRMKKLSSEGLVRTDKRVGLMNEILSAMDIVKCYAWEESFQSKVQWMRADELSWLRKSQALGALNNFILNSTPVVVAVVSFGMFTFLGGDLTPARAFTSLSLFTLLRQPLTLLPSIITQVLPHFILKELFV